MDQGSKSKSGLKSESLSRSESDSAFASDSGSSSGSSSISPSGLDTGSESVAESLAESVAESVADSVADSRPESRSGDRSTATQISERDSTQMSGSVGFKALNQGEVLGIANELQAWMGAQLQGVLQGANEVALGFYRERQNLWLLVDLNPLRPMIVRIEGKSPSFINKKTTRPLGLFLKSRFLGRRLSEVRAESERGRILVLGFHRAASEGVSEPIEIEIRLFPHGQNVIARDAETWVAEMKPRESAARGDAFEGLGKSSEQVVRSWNQIEQSWRELRDLRTNHSGRSVDSPPGGETAQKQQGTAPQADPLEKAWTRAIEKKTKALEQMRLDLEKKTNSVYREVGEWMKAHGSTDVPEVWKTSIDTERGLAWNIEEAFRRAKENERKAEGARQRISVVEAELERLRKQGPRSHAQEGSRKESEQARSLLVQAEARGRRHKIGLDLEVYVGKSASDNLAILRRAQPFDYWLHLREQPGSHGILRRARGRNVSDAELLEAGRWVAEQSTGRRINELKGERFDLLVVEARFVRPIKGDRLGRVTYTHARVLPMRF